MATKSRSKTRSTGSSSSNGRSRSSGRRSSQSGGRSEYGGSRRAGLRGRMQGAMRSAAENGIRVRADMTEPKVARIVIEIDWEELASRMARRVGRNIKRRVAGRARQTRRASTS